MPEVPCSSVMVAGVTDLLDGSGVPLCSRIYLSMALLRARSALAPGLMGDANLLPMIR